MKSKDPLINPDQVSKIEEQFQQQNLIIENLQRENQELQEIILQKDNETVEWRNLVEEYQKRINKLRPTAKENKKLKKATKEKKLELQKIRQELLMLRSKTSPEVRAKVDEMMKKQEDLAGKVGSNKMKISTLKKENNKLIDQKKDLINKIDELEHERDQANQELEEQTSLKKKFEELYSEEREKNLALRKHLDQLAKDDKKQIPRNQSARPKSASKYGRKNDTGNNSKQEDEFNKNEKLGTQDEFGSNASDEKEILLNRVSFEEVEHIAIELRNILKVKKISYNNIIDILPKRITALKELKDVLSNKFNFEEAEAYMTARYIFEEDEDDNENKVLFDEDKKINSEAVAERIQSFIRLNNTVEPYKLDGEESDDDIPMEIPKQSVETEKGKILKQSAKIETEVHEEIHDNYSEANEEFDIEEEKVTGNQNINNQDSPIIQDETDRGKQYKKEESDRHEESEIGEDEGLDIAEK